MSQTPACAWEGLANQVFSAVASYRVTLKVCEDYPERRERLLSACHQRCADRYERIHLLGLVQDTMLKLVSGRTGHTQS